MYGSLTPIDIHCSKLVDWLVQRRHCRKDWGENSAIIRRKIRAALGDMPEHEEIKQLLIGSKLDYFKSKRIVEILKTTEVNSKNFLGYYSSQRMKDWQDIVHSYEKDSVFLAEIATDLIRETNYEVPGIRKLTSKLRKEKEEAEKECANLQKKTQMFNTNYKKLAEAYGIDGIDVEHELNQKSESLTSVMNNIVDMSKNLAAASDYYREFASSTTKYDSSKLLSMLKYIIKKGNTTVYEWRFGEVPEQIECVEKATSTNTSEVELMDDEIDFGEDPPSSESSSGFVHLNKTDNVVNLSIEESYIRVEDCVNQTGDISADKVARGEDAKRVLEYRKSRVEFLNNLHELEAFYNQLLNDLTSDQNKSNSFLSEANPRHRVYDKSEIDKILLDIRKILDTVNLDKNRILFQMKDSTSFLHNVKEKFATIKKQISDCNVKADLLSEHIISLESQIKETDIHLKKSVAYAKELRMKMENSIQELYSGRPINIMGCVS